MRPAIDAVGARFKAGGNAFGEAPANHVADERIGEKGVRVFDARGAMAGEWPAGRVDQVDRKQVGMPSRFACDSLARLGDAEIVVEDRAHRQVIAHRCCALRHMIEHHFTEMAVVDI